MLEYMGREQLGLLIVDEAGQAAPQCAVGAGGGQKKAIIVGDPKQVEPVVTTDETLMTLYQRNVVSISCLLTSLEIPFRAKFHTFDKPGIGLGLERRG